MDVTNITEDYDNITSTNCTNNENNINELGIDRSRYLKIMLRSSFSLFVQLLNVILS